MRLIMKASGEREPFDIEKFRRSMKRAGASEKIIKKVAGDVEHRKDLKTTKDIYHYALASLAKTEPPIAARYNLKQALFQLGPTGFPFEKFLAQLFQGLGYEIVLDQIIPGKCVDHEVDIVLNKANKHYFVESKFHAKQGIKCDIKITLYIQARFEDIETKYLEDPVHRKKIHQAWAVTNTRFTSEAIKYALCKNIQAIDWAYPTDGSISFLIDKLGLYPITALTSLSGMQKRKLIEMGLILCKDVQSNPKCLKKIGLSQPKIDQVIAESSGACRIINA